MPHAAGSHQDDNYLLSRRARQLKYDPFGISVEKGRRRVLNRSHSDRGSVRVAAGISDDGWRPNCGGTTVSATRD